jgi:hypothetical protein
MRELGYVEGSDFDMVYRFSDGYGDRIPSLAEEVVRPGENAKPYSNHFPDGTVHRPC